MFLHIHIAIFAISIFETYKKGQEFSLLPNESKRTVRELFLFLLLVLELLDEFVLNVGGNQFVTCKSHREGTGTSSE